MKQQEKLSVGAMFKYLSMFLLKKGGS